MTKYFRFHYTGPFTFWTMFVGVDLMELRKCKKAVVLVVISVLMFYITFDRNFLS